MLMHEQKDDQPVILRISGHQRVEAETAEKREFVIGDVLIAVEAVGNRLELVIERIERDAAA